MSTPLQGPIHSQRASIDIPQTAGSPIVQKTEVELLKELIKSPEVTRPTEVADKKAEQPAKTEETKEQPTATTEEVKTQEVKTEEMKMEEKKEEVKKEVNPSNEEIQLEEPMTITVFYQEECKTMEIKPDTTTEEVITVMKNKFGILLTR